MRAIGGEVDGLVSFDVEGEKSRACFKLRTRQDSRGQFEVIADVKKLDRIAMVTIELQEGVGARSDDAAAELERLRNRTG